MPQVLALGGIEKGRAHGQVGADQHPQLFRPAPRAAGGQGFYTAGQTLLFVE